MLFKPLANFRRRSAVSGLERSRRCKRRRRLNVRTQVERLEDRVMLSTLGTGEVQTVLELPTDPPNHPEGVAVDGEDGTIYVGNRVMTTDADGNPIQTSEIFRIDPEDGTVAEFATLPEVTPAASGLLGLAAYQGDVYAALASLDFSTRGVYRISQGGAPHGPEVERFAGSQFMVFPNAITFDDAGHMYVTDSFGPDFLSGAVWRFDADEPGESGELWVQDDLLSPSIDDPFGFPSPGANGVAFFPAPEPHLYVANTEKGLVAAVAINEDGSAGPVDVVANTGPFGPLGTIDGIQVDVNGDIHGVIPGAAVLGTSPLVRVDAQTGTITPTVTDPDEAAKFDLALSLAFGRLPHDEQSVYVTNGDLGELPPTGPGEAGPGLIQVGVGVKGFELNGNGHGSSSGDGGAPVGVADALDSAAQEDDAIDTVGDGVAESERADRRGTHALAEPAQTLSVDGDFQVDRPSRAGLVASTEAETEAVDRIFGDLDDDLPRHDLLGVSGAGLLV